MSRRTSRSRVRSLGSLALGLALCAGSATALAHIALEQGTPPIHSRDGTSNLKAAPCGRQGSTRGTEIYQFKPGDTITLSVDEFVAHPSYFRIAFDDDGDDDFVDPRSIKPIQGFRACLNDNGQDKCGQDDFYNNSTVLMDNLDPHIPSSAADTKIWTWQVKLPDVTCERCTLQVIQVMEDSDLHGPYNPDGAATEGFTYVADVYHQCVDLVLSPDADPSKNPTAVPAISADGGVEVAGNADASVSTGAGGGGGEQPGTGGAGSSSSGGSGGSDGGGAAGAASGGSESTSSGGGGASPAAGGGSGCDVYAARRAEERWPCAPWFLAGLCLWLAARRRTRGPDALSSCRRAELR
jgi:hypothetical protein